MLLQLFEISSKIFSELFWQSSIFLTAIFGKCMLRNFELKVNFSHLFIDLFFHIWSSKSVVGNRNIETFKLKKLEALIEDNLERFYRTTATVQKVLSNFMNDCLIRP